MVRTGHPLHPNASTSPMGDAAEMLRGLLDIWIAQGLSPRALDQQFHELCVALKEPEHTPQAVSAEFITQLGQVIAHWYDDPAYVDEIGVPLPLTLRSERPADVSFATLVERVLPGQNAEEILKMLLRSPASIRAVGTKYEPIQRFTPLSGTFPLVQVQNLITMRGLLRTLNYNRSCEHPAQQRVERKAGNLDIPLREHDDVQNEIKARAGVFMEQIDGYLNSKAVSPGSEPTVAVNVVVFSYEEALGGPHDKGGRPKP